MTNPLIDFTGPRRVFNSTEYAQTGNSIALTAKGTQLGPNLLLGPGIVATSITTPNGDTYVKLNAPDVASLLARIAALEAVLVIRDGFTYLKNPQGQIVITLGQDSGQRTLAFFDGQNPQPQVVLDPGSSTLQDVIFELNAKNLTVAP